MIYLKKTIKAFFLILRNPWLLNHLLDDNNVWKKYVTKHYQMDKGLPVVEIDELIPNFSETLNTYTFLDGGSTPLDLSLLKGLARKFTNCRYFEIGTWRGESVVNVAEIAKECTTLNLPVEEMDEKEAGQIGFFSKDENNITQIFGNTKTFDFEKNSKHYDLVFIDGDHHYEQVKQDTKNIFKHLTHKESIIVWHDYAFHPEKVRYEVMAGILDGIPKEKRNNLYHVSNTLSAIYINEKMPSSYLIKPTTPNKKFKLSIEVNRL